METVINIYKKQGITPYQLIQKLKSQMIKFSGSTIGFAGRLDPLAHGVLLLLVDEENKKREKYNNLEKIYNFSVLLGLETDSYDYLGIIQSDYKNPPPNKKKKISQFVTRYQGSIKQEYPPFSSKTINGKAMFKLAKKGKLKDMILPTHIVKIYEFNFLSLEQISSKEVKQTIITNLKKIKGYFRQTKIKLQWNAFFKNNQFNHFTIAKFMIRCSSGTYVRTLAHQMGQELGCGAIAYEILRTQVGEYQLSNSILIE